ncbi:hypothetical protein BDF20DRAFT_490981 [Mycotypha africana]|uniref:uncharacterized protein n=1 Tax=Mycotypha africana TaxID=64632 RepID=UPI0023012C47|nr:uncharacterized protein BDF20DRAFT_490981 [Mycotypha africana]KAI8979261.1 hypothetical protein BDF20DRAFT_490981 [Mycotypha africana]
MQQNLSALSQRYSEGDPFRSSFQMNLRPLPLFNPERLENTRQNTIEQEALELFGLQPPEPAVTTTAPSSPDRLQLYGDYDFDNDLCPICGITDLEKPSEDKCVNQDVSPNVYFCLSVILGNSVLKDTLLPDALSNDNNSYSKDDKEMIQRLVGYAAQLAEQRSVAEEILDTLHSLLAKYTLEGMKEVVTISNQREQQQLQQTQGSSNDGNLALHLPRELKFISACLNDVSKQTFDMISSQVNQEKPIDLQKIVFTDVRYARLLPLLCIIYESHIPSLSQSRQPTADDLLSTLEGDRTTNNLFTSVNATANNEIVILSSSDADNRPMSNGSFDPHILSLGLHSAYSPLRSSQLQQRSFFSSQFEHSRSQTNLPSSTSLFSQKDLASSQIEVEETEASIDEEVVIEQKVMTEEEGAISTIELPDYDILSTPELKAKLKSYGFKTSNNRTKMIEELKKIFKTLHQMKQMNKISKKNKNNEGTSNNTGGSSHSITDDNRYKKTQQSSEQQQVQVEESEEEEEVIDLINIGGSITSDNNVRNNNNTKVDPDVREEIIQHLKSNKDIWTRILMYQPVSVEECQVGLKRKKNEIKSVLDEVAAAKGSNTFHVKKKPKTTAPSASSVIID